MLSFLLLFQPVFLILWQSRAVASPQPSPSSSSSPPLQAVAGQGLSASLGDYLSNPFVLVIWILFLTSFVILVRYLRQLPKQYAELDIVESNYNSLVKTLETNPDAIRKELLKNTTDGSIGAQRIEELHRISAQGGDFDQLALGEVLAAREGARTSIARYGASVLVLLGLCGAIWGLSNLVFQMGPELRNMEELASHASTQGSAPILESVRVLISTMAKSLEHTKGAFLASLTGIILSVILLFMNWIVSRYQVRFLTRLEDLTVTRLIPVLKPPREASELVRVVEAFKEGSGYVNSLADQVDANLKQVGGNLENLFAIVRKFGDGAEALQLNQKTVFDAQTRMLEVVEDFTGLTRRIDEHQSGAAQRIEQVTAVVEQSNKNFSRAIAEWQKKHETLLQLIQQNNKQAHEETKEVRELARTGIAETTTLLKDSIDRQLNELRSQALQMLETQQTGNLKHLGEMLTKQGEFVSSLQTAVLTGDGHREVMEGVNRVITDERQLFSDRIDRMLEKELSLFSNRLDKMLDQNERAVSALSAMRVAPDIVVGGNPVRSEIRTHGQTDNASLIAKQEQLIHRVGLVDSQLASLNSLFIALIGLIGFAGTLLGGLGIMRQFGLWPDGVIWEIVTLMVLVIASCGAGYGLTWMLKRKASSW